MRKDAVGAVDMHRKTGNNFLDAGLLFFSVGRFYYERYFSIVL